MAAPTIVAVETDSAWVVILCVSFATLLAVFGLRRLIRRPGGLASSLLLMLPLMVPLIAAVLFQHGVLPEIAVLRPLTASSLDPVQRAALHLVLAPTGGDGVMVPYVVSGSTGPYLVLIGVVFSTLMLIRRAIGFISLKRLLARCEPANPSGPLAERVRRLSSDVGLASPPEVVLLPAGVPGAFAVAGKRPRILLAPALQREMSPGELDALLAHELAHLAARDIPVIVGAGILRDLVAWNPFAHVALRRLVSDREVEADRRAASVTGDALAVASSLVRMCEIMRGMPRRRVAAVAFWRPRGRLKMRVASLLALADAAPVTMPAVRSTPYVLAACLAALLGLQVGARVASEDAGAFAIVLSAPSHAHVSTWKAPAPEPAQVNKRASRKDVASRAHLIEQRFPTLAKHYAFKERSTGRLMAEFRRYVMRRGIGEPLMWGAHHVVTSPGGFVVYRLESLPRIPGSHL